MRNPAGIGDTAIRVIGRGLGHGNLGGIVTYSIGTDSEVGCLRTVLVHRPGAELRRITPRTKSRLGFDGQLWVALAQQEHDALTDLLRGRGAENFYVTEMLHDWLQVH